MYVYIPAYQIGWNTDRCLNYKVDVLVIKAIKKGKTQKMKKYNVENNYLR